MCNIEAMKLNTSGVKLFLQVRYWMLPALQQRPILEFSRIQRFDEVSGNDGFQQYSH